MKTLEVPRQLAEKLRHRVVWQALPGSQELAMINPVNEFLYSGTRGPGKTEVQLMNFRSRVGQGYGSHWRGVIFDRRYKDLDDIIKKSRKFYQFGDGARFLASGELKWVWPTGEELMIRHMHSSNDYWNYHGQEYSWIGWNELTKQPTSELYDMMLSCNRTSFIPEIHSPELTYEEQCLLKDCRDSNWPLEDMVGTAKAEFIRKKILPPIPLQVFATTNPFGAGHNWVKDKWIEPNGVRIPPGKVIKTTQNIFNPQTQRNEDVTRSQAYLQGSWKENTYLPPQYILGLTNISDPNKRKAWLKGSWDITSGGALDNVWYPEVQVVPRFKLPPTWEVVQRSMDWGSTHPFSVGWWAIATGEEVLIPGTHPNAYPRKFCPHKGSLVQCHELYGTEKIGTNRGIKLGARKLAKRIAETQAYLRAQDWIPGEVKAGPADNQIDNVNDEGTKTIADLMAAEGIRWKKSDKSAGSRKIGLELVRGALENSVAGDAPGLYFMDHCIASIKTLPNLPRDEDDPDDVDTEAEDHPYDMVRYMVLHYSKTFLKISPIDMH